MSSTTISPGKLVLFVLWPPVAATMVGLALIHQVVMPTLAARPPVVVMDVDKSIRQGLDAQGSDTSLKAAVAKTETAAKALRDNGYVVLNGSYVYAYPQRVEVTP